MHIVTNSSSLKNFLEPHHRVFLTNSEEILTDWYDPDQFDLIVVDITSSDETSAPRRIRERNEDIPIIGVGQNYPIPEDAAQQRAIFVENGGSCLLQEPIYLRELLAYITSLAQIFRKPLNIIHLCDGRLVIEIKNMRASFDGETIAFTDYETKIFMELAGNYNCLVKSTRLNEVLYPRDCDLCKSNTLKVFLSRIRKKLCQHHPELGHCIYNTRGIGYRLVNVLNLAA